MSNIISALNWRYATKVYDSSKKLSDEQVNLLLDAVRLSPASFGLQSYKIINVVNPEIRQKLRAASYDQAPTTDASHLFVFVVPTKLSSLDVEKYIAQVTLIRSLPVESLKGYQDMINGSVSSRSDSENVQWMAKQAYIALGILHAAAALESIDTTPMEGFNPQQYDEILGLSEKGLTSVLVCAAGFRSVEDKSSNYKKVRTPIEELVVKI